MAKRKLAPIPERNRRVADGQKLAWKRRKEEGVAKKKQEKLVETVEGWAIRLKRLSDGAEFFSHTATYPTKRLMRTSRAAKLVKDAYETDGHFQARVAKVRVTIEEL